MMAAVKPRDILKYRVAGMSDIAQVETALNRLVEYNWVRKASIQLIGGKKAHIFYLITPKITEEK